MWYRVHVTADFAGNVFGPAEGARPMPTGFFSERMNLICAS
jgi:hypothetical protein